MIGAYIRVSSRSQSYASQRDAIERAATARGDVISTWFAEKRSGSKLERPVLQSVRDRARLGELGRLYVFRLDRLTRSGIRDTLATLEELRSAGCEVVSVADGFSLTGPGADVVVAVVAWAAQMERLALGERISAARARVEAKGGRWGRPPRVDELLATRIRNAKEMNPKASTTSVRELAARFKVPRSTVLAVLSGKGPYAAKRKTAAKRPGRKR